MYYEAHSHHATMLIMLVTLLNKLEVSRIHSITFPIVITPPEPIEFIITEFTVAPLL